MDQLHKVKLKREVAEAIESLRKKGTSTEDIVMYVLSPHGNNGHTIARNIRDGHIDFDTFLKALVVGYEVEMTPEDKVKELYKDRIREADSSKVDTADRPYFNGICRGIKETLDALNIKISGVND